MSRMPELKKSGELVQAYLLSLGIDLPASKRLELVARARGFKSYAEALAEEQANLAKPQNPARTESGPTVARAASLADLINQEAVAYVVINGRKYSLRYYNSEGLSQVADGRIYDYTQELTPVDIALELEAVEGGVIFEEALTLGQIDAARYAGGRSFTIPNPEASEPPSTFEMEVVLANKTYEMEEVPGPFYLYQQGQLYSMIPTGFETAKLLAHAISKSAWNVDIRNSNVITGAVLYRIQKEFNYGR